MKKKKKQAFIMLLCLFVCILFALLYINSVIGNSGPQKYLSKKYNIDINDINIIEYQKNHFESDIGFLFLDASNKVWYVNRKWICEYNGRTFTAEYYLFRFMDDYQLEDIFKWCTEYLQKNYDKKIVGVEVYSDIIYHSPRYNFDYKLPWNSSKVFTENDSEKILETLSNIPNNFQDKSLTVFYKTDDLYKYANADSRGLLCLEKESYFEFRTSKEAILSNYGICNIVITYNPIFDRDVIGADTPYIETHQINISITDDTDYVFEKTK